jgi:glutamyl-tRNA synthetase
MMDISEKIREFALENAVKFKGKASKGAIIGKLMGLDNTLKSRMQEVSPEIDRIIAEVNTMDSDSQKVLLLKMNPDFETQQQEKKQQQKEVRQELPDLESAEIGKVTTRMAPEPSKYNHIGHALSFLINNLYANKYKGKCILRFDDTNPEKETQEFVDAMHSDVLDYIGIKPEKIIFASDDMDKFVEYAEKLIDEDKAYVCVCPRENISKDRRAMQECSHRSQSKEENKALWDAMKDGTKKDAVLRLKIDMQHKNAVMRDPVIYRVVDAPHYRQKDKYKVWPMYDFEAAIEEGLHNVTHVMRSNEFDSRIELQDYIGKLFNLPKVYYRHYGRFNIVGAITQGREIRAKIEDGTYVGWDDPRLVTLRALKRRGVVAETYYRLAKICGMSKTQTNIDFTMISAINRQILDETAKRFFFIANPVEVTISDSPEKTINLDVHPTLDLGKREFVIDTKYLLENKDLTSMKEGEIIRLIDNLNFKKEGDLCTFDSEEYVNFRGKGKKIIQWLPKNSTVDAEILMPDTKVIKGKGEISIGTLEIGDVIQFQRFGFCRLDAIEGNVYKFWFTHE